jgi:hypothetical protein
MLRMLNTISEQGLNGTVTAEAMRAACDEAFPALRDKLDALWADCPPSCQDLLRRVLDEGSHLELQNRVGDFEATVQRQVRVNLFGLLGEGTHGTSRYVKLLMLSPLWPRHNWRTGKLQGSSSLFTPEACRFPGRLVSFRKQPFDCLHREKKSHWE